ncbi:unnamed protein product [Cuscuta epithymum]|uniref:Uncharacterized protein n=1 Tax=Cuscuta epithymum TaxID=186058 RepID=A0AAV0DLB6_9ASTE|nr:unnamed protein product [Cuscuta epithymum]
MINQAMQLGVPPKVSDATLLMAFLDQLLFVLQRVLRPTLLILLDWMAEGT